MSAASLVGLLLLVVFVAALAFYALVGRRWPATFRRMPSLEALGTAIERAVEAGERVHVSLGTGSTIGSDSAPALSGLSVLSRVAAATTMSDRPAIVTTGDGAMMLLGQDTIRTAFARMGAGDRYQANSGRMLGPSPYSYIAGLPVLLSSEDVSAQVLLGSFGAEGALAAEFGERRGAFVLAGTDDVQSQALLVATAEHPLIGEEVFAAGAYLNVGALHRASLRTQDALRILLIAAILVGTLLRTLGIGL